MTKRSKDLGGLNPDTMRSGKWRNDIDYIQSLSHEEKLWMSQFLDEYYNDKFHKEKAPIHQGKKLRNDCDNRHNEARRDVLNHTFTDLSVSKSRYSPDDYKKTISISPESALIDHIDEKMLSDKEIAPKNKKQRKSEKC